MSTKTLSSIGSMNVRMPHFVSPAVQQVAATKELQHFLDGRATYSAIVDCVHELSGNAPEHHDTLIDAFGLIIDQVTFQKPHTLRLGGTDDLGQRAVVVAHYSQVAVRVSYIPRTAPDAPSREMGFHTVE